MRILNLYSGLGGNRSLWGNNHQVTAVEYNEDIAQVYRDRFPDDKVIVGDAHEYLLNNFKDYDFIWSSPPCQSHSNFRQNICVRYRGTEPVYPDMKLYQEVLLLQYNFGGDWVIENVVPYYKPLIEPTTKAGRHLFWSNHQIDGSLYKEENKVAIRKGQIPQLQELHGIDLSSYHIGNKRQLLRNCVDKQLGLFVFNQVAYGGSNGSQES